MPRKPMIIMAQVDGSGTPGSLSFGRATYWKANTKSSKSPSGPAPESSNPMMPEIPLVLVVPVKVRPVGAKGSLKPPNDKKKFGRPLQRSFGTHGSHFYRYH